MRFYGCTDMSGLKLGGTKIFLKEILSMINYQVTILSISIPGNGPKSSMFWPKTFFQF